MKRIAIDCAGASMSCALASLSAQTTDAAHIYLGLNIVICLNCFSISIDFILGKSWWFEKAKLIKHKLWSAAGRLDVTLRKKNVFNEQKMLLINLIKNRNEI